MILAIDPGTTESAWLLFAGVKVHSCGIDDNDTIRKRFYNASGDHQIAIEMVACYGMPVGAETFETCVWIGRFIESFGGGDYVYRKDVKLHLCQNARAKDANVRQALLDLFPRTGGGSTPQVGTKNKPGPLFGVRSHIWSALGVAVTYRDTKRKAVEA